MDENKQTATPLFDEVIKRASRNILSFQTPGHNNGLAFNDEFKQIIKDNLFHLDFSVCGNVDSLENPKTFIKEAQNLLTQAYGTKKSFFLVNGSTLGNQIMFLSSFVPGDKVIVPRNAHKSVLGSIILSGVRPIWIYPQISNGRNITYNITAKQISDTIKRHPDIKGVLIVNPTYHGVSADLETIRKITAANNKLLLVDEAWGAHLKFHSSFPKSAVEIGADACVQSFHKMLPSLNQSSVLHINSSQIDISQVERIISLVQTTSPSYLSLALMDYTRSMMFNTGHELLKIVKNQSDKIIHKIEKLGLQCLTLKQVKGFAKEFGLDPMKITIFTEKLGLTGYELEKILEKEFNIQIECSNYDNVIIIIKFGLTDEEIEKLITALAEIKSRRYNEKIKIKYKYKFNSLGNQQIMEPHEAFFRDSRWIRLDQAKDAIAGETISVYPPGIPVLIPGEKISGELIAYLTELKQKGASLSSLDKNMHRIKVIDF